MKKPSPAFLKAKDALMKSLRRFDAFGGIGQSEDSEGNPAIVVYVSEEGGEDQMAGMVPHIPHSFRGIPVIRQFVQSADLL